MKLDLNVRKKGVEMSQEVKKTLNGFVDALKKIGDDADKQAAFFTTANLIWSDYSTPIKERCKILQQMLDELDAGKDKK